MFMPLLMSIFQSEPIVVSKVVDYLLREFLNLLIVEHELYVFAPL